MSISLQLYLIGGIEILVPVMFLILYRRSHKFRISSVISGIGSYFLASNILMGTFSMFMASAGLDQQFWTNHSFLSNIVNVLLNVVFSNITIFLVMKFVLKKKIRVYDAVAMGVSYWVAEALMLSTSSISYARIASMSAEGRLKEMVTESLPLDKLEEYASNLQTLGISSFYIQVLGIIVLSIISAVICVFLFHAVKRDNLKFLWMTMGVHLLILAMMNLSLAYGGDIPYIIANVVAAAIAIVIYMQYWKWYKGQQMELSRKRQEYKQRQKAATGNVISVKVSEESNDITEQD